MRYGPKKRKPYRPMPDALMYVDGWVSDTVTIAPDTDLPAGA